MSKKVHYVYSNTLTWTVCGSSSSEVTASTDPAKTTCGKCRRTWAFKRLEDAAKSPGPVHMARPGETSYCGKPGSSTPYLKDVTCTLCRQEFMAGLHSSATEVETDPNELKAGDPGAKFDKGKIRPGLVLGGFARALEAVARVGTDGAAKYSDNGWREVGRAVPRYEDAMLRHWLKRAKGETSDPDSGSLHLAHMAWNILAMLEKTLEESERD